jgi:kallikrein 5
MFQGIKSIPHPGYCHPRHSNDLMLVKLDKKIQNTHAVKPITISPHCPSVGTQCMVSGWGTTSSPQSECPISSCPHPSPSISICPHLSLLSYLTDNFPKVLQCLNITVLSEERCKKAYPGQIDQTMFCAGDEAGRDSCQVRTGDFSDFGRITLSAKPCNLQLC